MEIYNELNYLSSYFNKKSVSIKRNATKDIQPFKRLELNLDNNIYIIYVDDEYNDVNEANQLMCFFLILRELEIFNDSTDYLNWCKQLGVNLIAYDQKLRAYYNSLKISYSEIEKALGKIDSCISSLDYQLSTGVVKKLRSM